MDNISNYKYATYSTVLKSSVAMTMKNIFKFGQQDSNRLGNKIYLLNMKSIYF